MATSADMAVTGTGDVRMPIRELTTPLTDELLEVLFGISDGPAVEDPEAEPGASSDELPTDVEEFAAPPRDER